MWTRRELKECAKQLLKINYWKAVLAGVILSLIGGSGVVSVVERSSSGSFDEVIGAVETDDFGLVLGIALGIVAVALLVNSGDEMYLVGDQQERWKECWLDYVCADIVCKLMESFVYNSGNYKTV